MEGSYRPNDVHDEYSMFCNPKDTSYGVSRNFKNFYFVYTHSIISNGIILGGNQPHSEKIFKIKKRVIRIITNSRARDSCRELFKKLEILPLYSQYIFSLSIFVIKN